MSHNIHLRYWISFQKSTCISINLCTCTTGQIHSYTDKLIPASLQRTTQRPNLIGRYRHTYMYHSQPIGAHVLGGSMDCTNERKCSTFSILCSVLTSWNRIGQSRVAQCCLLSAKPQQLVQICKRMSETENM